MKTLFGSFVSITLFLAVLWGGVFVGQMLTPDWRHRITFNLFERPPDHPSTSTTVESATAGSGQIPPATEQLAFQVDGVAGSIERLHTDFLAFARWRGWEPTE